MKIPLTIAVLALLVPAAGLIQAQEIGLKLKLDHFAFYKAAASPHPPSRFKFKGQFDKEPQERGIAGLKAIGYPTGKDGGKIIQKNEFLTLNGIKVLKQPKREVLIENQFGEQRLITGNVVALLVPSVKSPGKDVPRILDHFIVYEVLESEPAIKRNVTLKGPSGEGKCSVLSKLLFAVPIEKTHNGKITKIKNPEAHLTLYAVESPEVKPVNFRYKNQFWDEDAGRTIRQYLAVPTIKQEWEELR